MMEGSGSLEQQLEATKRKAAEVRSRKTDLKRIEDLGAILEEHLILDNRYTEHSTVGLAQQWDQLDQLGMRMQHNLEQQIQARNQSGVSEDALKEFSMMFKHFDKDKSGRLNQHEFKSCLRALGYDLPMVEEGQPDPEFEAILDVVDPNRDGYVSLQEYMAFMISKETENVQSSEEIENAFRAITAGDRPYVTKEELYAAFSLVTSERKKRKRPGCLTGEVLLAREHLKDLYILQRDFPSEQHRTLYKVNKRNYKLLISSLKTSQIESRLNKSKNVAKTAWKIVSENSVKQTARKRHSGATR
ncbi:hypothetical protein J6590_103759 [Homalodisca vitripennis]|nr:hypothetical protein J6590_012187 [Homalodisca vitripennis]KAG8333766.1 hypothetical protein J6590_103759 [Homalodisca vitripennis]